MHHIVSIHVLVCTAVIGNMYAKVHKHYTQTCQQKYANMPLKKCLPLDMSLNDVFAPLVQL